MREVIVIRGRDAGRRGTVLATRGGMSQVSLAGRIVRVSEADVVPADGTRRRFGNRVQVAPVVDRIERQVAEEDWRSAAQSIRDLARTLGVAFTGGNGARVSTEWFSGLDREDKDRFLDFVRVLQNLFSMVEPLALRSSYGRKDDRWPAWIESLRRDLPWVQDLMRDESDAFRHGKFLVIPLKGVQTTDEAVKALDEASAHIQGHFPEVLYGKVYVRRDLHPKGTYGPQHSGGPVAGAYQAPTDTITISMYATPERNSVMSLIHEFGHRYHTRFLKGDQREKFIQLSTVGDVHEEFFPLAERERFADEWIARSRGFRDDPSFGSDGPVQLSERAEFFFRNFPRDEFKAKVSPLNRRFDDGDDAVVPKLRRELARSQFGGRLRVIDDEPNLHPIHASAYGETSWEENFADSFLAFCMRKPLPVALQRFMASLGR
jgi:hypothetical protein